jgi:hypothetical protein
MNNKDMFDSTSQEEKNNKMKPCSWDNECPITKYLAYVHRYTMVKQFLQQNVTFTQKSRKLSDTCYTWVFLTMMLVRVLC